LLLAPTLRGWVGAVSVIAPSGGDASDKGVTTAPSRPLSKARGVTPDCSWPLPCRGWVGAASSTQTPRGGNTYSGAWPAGSDGVGATPPRRLTRRAAELGLFPPRPPTPLSKVLGVCPMRAPGPYPAGVGRGSKPKDPKWGNTSCAVPWVRWRGGGPG